MSDDANAGPQEDPWSAPPLPDEPDGHDGPPAAPAPPPPPPPALPADAWSPGPRWTTPPPMSRPDPWGTSINTGLPASLPASPPGWEAGYPYPPPGPPPVPGSGDARFAPADPAEVSGPPWPVLVAPGGFTPPRLITWPIFAGCGILVAYIVIAVVAAANFSSPRSTTSWLLQHDSTIATLNSDQTAIQADVGNTTAWIADWQKLRTDAEAAAALPNPGGAATTPWREMLNDYVNGAGEVIQAEHSHNATELQQAEQILTAGDSAAQRFNNAMGTG